MTESCSLISKVLSYLECDLEVKYIGALSYTTEEIEDEPYDYYKLIWYLNQQDQPVIMHGQFESEDDFFEYLKKEIRSKRLHQVEYMIGRKLI